MPCTLKGGGLWSKGGYVRKTFLWVAIGIGLSTGFVYANGPIDVAAVDTRLYGVVNCRIEKPLAWNAGHISWLGKCESGYAHGSGVLRNMIDGAQTELFLGRVEQGYLRNGVLQTNGGYIAGRWKDGVVIEDDADDQAKRNAMLAAFEEAAKSADATSRTMARQSNAASSRFYAQLANRLRMQMD